MTGKRDAQHDSKDLPPCIVCGAPATSSVAISTAAVAGILDVAPQLAVQHNLCRKHLAEWSYRTGGVLGGMMMSRAKVSGKG